jgi:DME family drug/metabolite transporter
MSSRTRSLLFLVTAAVLWSTSGVFLKSMPSVHWLAIAGTRSFFAALIFLPGLAQARPPLRKLVAGVVLYAALVSALMGSMQLGTAAQGIWLQYVAPALVALWAWLVQRQRIRPVEAAAAALTVVAVFLIVTGGSGRAHQQSVLLGVGSGFAFAAFIILLKSMGDTAPASIFFWTNIGTAAIVLPVAVSLGIPIVPGPRELCLLAAMGLFQLGLAYYFFQWALAKTRAVEASLIILLEPILNPIWVYFALGEIPAPKVIVGCALIAVALAAMAVFPNRRGVEGAAGHPGAGDRG